MSVITDREQGEPGAEAERGGKARAVAVAIGLTIAALITSAFGGLALLLPLFVLAIEIENAALFLGVTVAGQLGFAAVAYAYARYRGTRIPITRPSAREVGYALGGVVAALVVVQVLGMVLAALDLVPEAVLGDVAALDPNVLLAVAALSVVLVAPAGEFMFRGVVQGRLRAAFGPAGAIAGASLLFGSLHLANYAGAPEAVIAGALLIACVGAILGALYELTGTLTVPILAHAVYTVVLSVVAYLTL